MTNYFSQAGSFLVSTIIGLYITIVVIRFLFQLVRADFYNPLSQFIVKATNPLLMPLRKVVPGLFGLDMAALVLAYLLQVLELFLLLLLNGSPFSPILLLWAAIGQLLSLFLYIYLIAIIIQAVVSWINPGSYNPMIALITQLTDPLLRPARKLLPPFSGLDLSPLLVIIAINLLIMLIPALFG
ncbi:MAG: YggT family protein [Pseudomonadota bacterium]